MSPAVTQWVGNVSVCDPNVGALCHFEEVLPVLHLGPLYSIPVFVANVLEGFVRRVIVQHPEPVRLIVQLIQVLFKCGQFFIPPAPGLPACRGRCTWATQTRSSHTVAWKVHAALAWARVRGRADAARSGDPEHDVRWHAGLHAAAGDGLVYTHPPIPRSCPCPSLVPSPHTSRHAMGTSIATSPRPSSSRVAPHLMTSTPGPRVGVQAESASMTSTRHALSNSSKSPPSATGQVLPAASHAPTMSGSFLSPHPHHLTHV